MTQAAGDWPVRGPFSPFGDNPWAEPPEAVVNNGMAAVTTYFEDVYSSGVKTRRNTVKVVLVGQEGAGKTSLCRSMKTGRATPTDGATESTVFADVESMELHGAPVRVYDCAGQVAYTGLLQMFLTRRTVCLVVCDAGAFGERSHGAPADGQLEKDIQTVETLGVCNWLRSISQRVPESDVTLVATKCDLASGGAADTAGRMKAACQTWLAKWVRKCMAPVRLADEVCLTSCCVSASNEQEEVKSNKRKRGQSWECDWRDDKDEKPPPGMLHRVVNKKDGSGIRGTEMVLPGSWDIALTVLDALEHGRDPVEAAVQRSSENHGRVERTTKPFRGVTVDELNEKWKAVVDRLEAIGITVLNADHALEGALTIREFDGTVVRHETFVFLDVVWLTRILKPLLNHKETLSFDGTVYLGDTGDTRITLEDEKHIHSWNRFKEEGILEPELARVLWPALSKYVLPTLARLGLTFPLELDPAEGLVVLLGLGTARPKSVGEDIDEFCLGHSAVFDVCWDFFLGVPPGLIEKVLTRCCNIGTVQTFWRFGVLVQGTLNGSEGSGSFALVLEYSSDSRALGMKVYGDICTVAPWAALAYAISALGAIAADFPGLPSRADIKCPHRNHDTRMTITTRGPGVKLLRGRTCSRCSPQTGGVGAAAVELVRMVDVRQARGVVFREVNARFVCVQRNYAALRSEGPRDLYSGDFVSAQIKAAHGELLTDMEEYRALLSAGASAARGPDGQNELFQYLENLQHAVNDIRGRLGGDDRDVLGAVEAALSKIENLVAADDGVREILDVVVTMLMAVRGEKVDTPRQACVLPGDYAEAEGLTDDLRKPEVWTEKLEEWIERDFKAGKGRFKTKVRLFLVCAHTHELVPCGHDGRGYDVQHLRKWARMAVDVAKFLLQLASASLQALVVPLLPATTIVGALGQEAFESALSRIEGRLKAVVLRDDDGRAAVSREEVEALKGNAYEKLRKFVHEMEDTARLQSVADRRKASKKKRCNRPPTNSDFVHFEDVMTKVQARTGDGEAQWVLKGHEQAWIAAVK